MQARTRATTLASMMIQVSFLLIGRSLNRRIAWLLLGGVLVPNDRPQPEQLRADPRARPLRGAQIDPEPHSAVLHVKADHAAMLGKVVQVAHGQDVPPVRGLQHFSQPPRLR